MPIMLFAARTLNLIYIDLKYYNVSRQLLPDLAPPPALVAE